MAFSYITTETDQGVTSITLNRPEVLNSFHAPMARELLSALEVAARDANVRALLLSGAGRAFCAGQDLAEVAPSEGRAPLDFEEHVATLYNPIVRALRRLEKPVVCAVNGVAAGAGANLALACDLVLASEQATFIQAFSKIGLVPDSGGSFVLPRLVGLARATALLFLGERLSAEQALHYGLIWRVCSAATLKDESLALARQLASQATLGLGLTKRLLNLSFENDLDAQLDLEAELQGIAGRSADYAEGVAAFQAKRQPNFRGQ